MKSFVAGIAFSIATYFLGVCLLNILNPWDSTQSNGALVSVSESSSYPTTLRAQPTILGRHERLLLGWNLEVGEYGWVFPSTILVDHNDDSMWFDSRAIVCPEHQGRKDIFVLRVSGNGIKILDCTAVTGEQKLWASTRVPRSDGNYLNSHRPVVTKVNYTGGNGQPPSTEEALALLTKLQ